MDIPGYALTLFFLRFNQFAAQACKLFPGKLAILNNSSEDQER